MVLDMTEQPTYEYEISALKGYSELLYVIYS